MAARTSRDRRTTDWIDDLTAWALLAAGMLLIVVSLTVALGTSARMAEQAGTEAQDQGPRVARSDGASPAGQPDERRKDDADLVSVTPSRTAGRTVPTWFDRTGSAASKPSVGTEVLLSSLTAAAVVLGFGAAVLAGLWVAVRRATFAYNRARWEREWRAVEPIWSKGEDRRG